MRIFLSYAAERLAVAEQVSAALTAEGHEVFFARQSIAAATPFGQAIRSAVRRSDLFLFLVSPESVAPGSYCLTELGFAKERWPNPATRVLPVVVAPTDPDSFPPYIQGLSALVPAGNVAAEVVDSVERAGRERRRAFFRSRRLVLVLACLGAAAGLWGWVRERRAAAAARPYLEVGSVAEVRPAVAGEPALVSLRGRVRNPSPQVDSVVGLDLELDGGGARATPRGAFDPIPVDGDGAENFEQWYRLSSAGDSASPPRRWRACWWPGDGSGRVCQPWSDWSDGAIATASPLATAQRTRSRVVAAGPEGFLVGLAGPAELVMVAGPGRVARSVALPGEPSAIAVAGGRVAVGTRPPGRVVLLGPDSARSVFEVPGGSVNGSQVATGVASLALTDREAWVVTGGPDGEPAVRLLDLASGRWVPLPYEGDIELETRGLRLRAGDSSVVWGVSTATTPSSVYRLGRARMEKIDGSRAQAVSCARDLASAGDGTLFLLTCQGELLRGRPGRGRFTTVEDLDLRFFPFVKGDWEDEWLAGTPDTLAVAVTVLSNDSTSRDLVPVVGRIAWRVAGKDRPLVRFERDSLAVTSLAARGGTVLATVRSNRGGRDLIEVRLGAP